MWTSTISVVPSENGGAAPWARVSPTVRPRAPRRGKPPSSARSRRREHAGASGVLVNISHGENFSMAEFAAANDYIYDSVGEVNNPSIIMGDITIPELR